MPEVQSLRQQLPYRRHPYRPFPAARRTLPGIFQRAYRRSIHFQNGSPGNAHNSLIGCMTCQQVCPENKDFLDRFADEVAFSHEETSLLLNGIAVDQLPPETVQKLERIDMLSDLQLIPRNLGVFFN